MCLRVSLCVWQSVCLRVYARLNPNQYSRLLQAAAIEAHGRPASEIEMTVGPIRGGVSGGTIASASNMIARAGEPEIRNGPRGAAALCVAPHAVLVSRALSCRHARRATAVSTVVHMLSSPAGRFRLP